MIITEIRKEETNRLYDRWNTFKVNVSNVQMTDSLIQYHFPLSLKKREMCIGAIYNKSLIGCCSLYPKNFEHMSIGGIGRMAVDPCYRKQEVAENILRYLIIVMQKCEYDISILWASVLKVYEKVGYKAFHKNMMCLPIKKQLDVYMLSNLLIMPDAIGAW